MAAFSVSFIRKGSRRLSKEGERNILASSGVSIRRLMRIWDRIGEREAPSLRDFASPWLILGMNHLFSKAYFLKCPFHFLLFHIIRTGLATNIDE